ncbi:MAG: glycoside hydrolase family 3 C-terminal domain-containing protein [Blautia sp.]|nr:glycoside hydrolase family 3 C-terminal domain-containing protein [Blautia sp.]
MLEMIQKLVGPFLYNMGVSEADLTSYLQQLSTYVYIILAAAAILILVLLFAGLMAKKGSRAFLRLQTLIAFIATVAIVVNAICWGPMKTNVATFLNGSKVELTEETITKSKEVIKKVGEEGIVLLKNNGLLPVASDVKNLNVFGWASTNPIFGGTGSGSSDASSAVGILGSLKDAGYTTNEELSKIYTDYRTDRPTISMNEQDWTLPEPTVDVYTDDLMASAKEFSDTAVIVISRSGGENADLPTDMAAVIAGTYNQAGLAAAPANFTYMNSSYTNNGSYDDFEAGESYLELSVTEEQMVEKVCSEFDKVIVVINANNAMELGWVDEYEQIGAVLLAPGAGNTGFAALGEILNGSVNPSGRTADTFVKDLTKTPYYNTIGNRRYTNVDDLNALITQYDAAAIGNICFTSYVEGIYVGYKFYETAAAEGLINYEDYVQYPFGYGLSYTSFEQKIENFSAEGDAVTFDVTVTNTGDTAGKDVVEVYFTPPYTNGGIEKASVNLVDFAKTGAIEPGSSETLSFSIPKENMASYDSAGLKVAGGGYILEAGDYSISLRSDSHTELAAETFTVDADISYAEGRSSDQVPAVNQFQDYSRGNFVQLSRADQFKNYEEACGPLKEESYAVPEELKQVIANNTVVAYRPTKDEGDEMPTQGAEGSMKLAELRGASYDDEKWESLINQMSVEEMANVVNLGGWQTIAADSVGKLATSDCDGPAGLSNFITGVYGTAYPAELLMAQTWNKELLEEMGEAMSMEYKEANNFGWYGPAMNTHRSAFAGRNFEYFSEDGVLGGYLAAAEINGATRNGIYPYIKHFALNDMEINRLSVLMTWADEQAIREIYLKPFELAVKNFEGTSIAVMSSFNWIGSLPSCSNPYLLNNVLRDEWGFIGLVETDYDGSYGYMITEACIRNGGDLMLGFGRASTNSVDTTNPTTVKALRRAVRNIMYTQVNSGAYEDVSSAGGMDNMTKTFLIADGAIAAALLLLEIILLAVHGKNKKKRAAAE